MSFAHLAGSLAVVVVGLLWMLSFGDASNGLGILNTGLYLGIVVLLLAFLRQVVDRQRAMSDVTLAFASIAVGGIFWPLWFGGPFLAFWLGVTALAVIALPVMLIGLQRWTFAREEKTRHTGMAFTGFGVLFAVLIGIAIPLNEEVWSHQPEAAFAYPLQVAPLLEAYRQEHGGYPASLDDLPTKPRVPRLLQIGSGYKSDENRYTFSFYLPDTPDRPPWFYSSKDGRWSPGG